MDSIHLVNVAKAFLILVTSEFEECLDEPKEEHFEIARVLRKKIEEIAFEYAFIEENENIEGGLPNDVDFVDSDGILVKEEEVSFEYKTKAVQAFNEHKGKWKFKTFQTRFAKALYPCYIRNWESHVKMGGSRHDIYKKIEMDVMVRFREAREEFLTVHDYDLKRWGMQVSGEFDGFKFKASDSWIANLKKRNGIVSRKVQKFVSFRSIRGKEELQETVEAFRSELKPVLKKFNPDAVWNTDQTGFKYELLGRRTLSWKGERSTFGVANSPKNKATHSYTVQYVIALSGRIIGDAFICLQESKGRLGPRVQETIFAPPNLTISCSTSGKLTTSHVNYYLDNVIKPHAKGEILYIADQWTGQKDMNLYDSRFKNENVNMTVKFIPENCTDLCQPLDTYFHRELKFLAKQFYSYTMLHERDSDCLLSRNGVLKMQSLMHYLLSAPVFHPMVQYCWFSSGLWNGEKPIFKNVKEVCFNLGDMKCSTANCINNAFIKCSMCHLNICFNDFFHTFHMMECTSGPYV